MRRSWIAAAAVAATLVCCGRSAADPCLTSRRSPQCSSFYVTEIGYGFRLTPPLTSRSFTAVGDSITSSYEYRVGGRHLIHSDLGFMYNVSRDYAVGFTHYIAWDAGHTLFGGVKLRGRRWLSDASSVDVSGGVLLWSSEGNMLGQPSFIGGASMHFSPWQSLDLTVTSSSTRPYEYIYSDGGGVTYRGWSPRHHELGVHLGHTIASKPGLVLNGVALVTGGVIVGIIISVLANGS